MSSTKIGPSISCIATSLSSPSKQWRTSQVSLSRGLFTRDLLVAKHLRAVKGQSNKFINGQLKMRRSVSIRLCISEVSEGQVVDDELIAEEPVIESVASISKDSYYVDDPLVPSESNGGKPGSVSFYNRSYKGDYLLPSQAKNGNSLLWFISPAILVASFIFPSLYLRRILSAVFEDSLLTDFLILFFTEALFYCGVAVFVFLIHHLRRPLGAVSAVYDRNMSPKLWHRISSVAVLVLSLIIPMVTMGLVWPWTGPAASATLAPYLVGIVVQFAFEQYARYTKSPSWPVIPIIFQVYRLHQLNRAAQLVTALSFTVRGAEMSSHNAAISSSLGTLLSVLQLLGVICIWSLSSFLMRFYPSPVVAEE
ncbi:uncharacterized protein LOC124945024 [Impatiens glandulifera]|uniref:uncharacterized protein LOC124945024 n=1 Tax=Impatiens glandulifera TaxID=253017 RepID=UPI001FB0E7D1|nr:uncharacterized protein LOC124945024 [Impatiens glandulifera]